MQKKNIVNIMFGALAVQIIPILGNIFVNGWNWGLGDFIFSWVFFVVLGLTFKFVTGKITNKTNKIVAGIIIIAVFAFIWIRLATG